MLYRTHFLGGLAAGFLVAGTGSPEAVFISAGVAGSGYSEARAWPASNDSIRSRANSVWVLGGTPFVTRRLRIVDVTFGGMGSLAIGAPNNLKESWRRG